MSLSKWLPNKTLVWKEWKNNWFISVLFLFSVTKYSTLQLVNEYRQLREDPNLEMVYNSIVYTLSFDHAPNSPFLVLMVVCLASFMIGLERDRGSLNLLLAMPYSRQEIIYNKFVLGLSQITGIFVLNGLFMLTILLYANRDIKLPYGVTEIWQWALMNIVVLGFVFAFTMFISSMSGTTMGNVILSLIFLFFPLGFMELIGVNLYIWGFTEHYYNQSVETVALLMTVPTYIFDVNILEGYNLSVVVSILAILTWGLYQMTQYLFAKNQLENNGELLMFHQLEGFFKLGVTLCFALLGGIIFSEIFVSRGEITLILGYLLSGGIVWFLTNILIKHRKCRSAA